MTRPDYAADFCHCGERILRRTHRDPLGGWLPCGFNVHEERVGYFPGFGHLRYPTRACALVEGVHNPFRDSEAA